MSVSGKYKSLAFLLAAITVGGFFLFNLPDRFYSYSRPYAEETKPESKETVLFLAGDVMLSRNVGSKITGASDPLLPFAGVATKIKQASLAFANLESPFYDQGGRVTEGMVFKAEPLWVEGLKQFAVLQTANNHSADKGTSGLIFTNELLLENNIKPAGTGQNCSEGTVLEKNGITFGFLAYSYAGYNDGGRQPNPLVCDWNDWDGVKRDIKTLRPKVDILIVAPHMGLEYRRLPERPNVEKVQAAIDAGADLVVGSHPHWIQPVEQYKDGWIFYSLGNFVFDQMWSQDTREGLTAFLTFKGKALKKIELKPVVIENYCCPRWSEEAETEIILKKINLTSQVLLDKN